MATKFVFGNQVVAEPGVRSRLLGGTNSTPQVLSTGNVLLVDLGEGAQYGGTGIDGELTQGINTIARFDNIRDLQSHLKGGSLFPLATGLFNPSANGIAGASMVNVVHAKSSTAAIMSLILASGGQLSIKPLTEGLIANGILGDEISAVGTISIDSIVVGNKIEVFVDAIKIGEYIIQATDTLASTASALVSAINEDQGYMGVRTIASGNIITLSAPYNKGVLGNALILSTTITGLSTTTVDPFMGGVDGVKLTKGYAMKLESGVVNTSAFRLSIFLGTYTGESTDGLPWNELSIKDSKPKLVSRSIEVTTIEQLVAWAQGDYAFSSNFHISASVGGIIDISDLITYADPILAVGGTEEYTLDALNQILDVIGDLNINFIISTDFGTKAKSANNIRLQSWIRDEARFKSQLYVGGREDQATFNNGVGSSVDIATFYDDENVTVVHGAPFLSSSLSGAGQRRYNVLHKIGYICGREAGLAPQVPLTFKTIKIAGEVHEMTEKERIIALDHGVLHTRYDNDVRAIIVNQGVNTLQSNSNLYNNDGSSYEKQIVRIKNQVNRTVVVGARVDLLGQANGVNLNTLAPIDVKQWLTSTLSRMVATTTTDNLITSFADINVRQLQDAYEITYGITPNGPVNKLLFTGLMLDANLTA